MKKTISVILVLFIITFESGSISAQEVIKISTPKVKNSPSVALASADNPGSPASQTLTFSEDETFNSTGDIETGLAVPVSLDLREMDIVDTI
ncbi:MAG: hypothetical protein ABIH08_02790, partial [Candidatus Omnitrophota bacterium]